MAASDGIDGVGRVRWGWFVNGHVYYSYCFVLCVVGIVYAYMPSHW